jgi:hypothetical protein
METEIKRFVILGKQYRDIFRMIQAFEKRFGGKSGWLGFSPKFDFSNVRFVCGNNGIENIAKMVFGITKYCSDDCLLYVAKKSMEYYDHFTIEYIFSKFIKNWIVINARDEVAKKLGVDYFGREYKESHIWGSQRYYPNKIVLWGAHISYSEFHEVFYYGVIEDDEFSIEYGEIDYNKLRPMRFRNDRVYYPPHEMNGFFDRNDLNIK